jgi:hypothetical protein
MNDFVARFGRYLRRNHLGLIAIFLALNGVAYAAVSKGTVDSESVRDRSLKGVDVQSGAIHARNLNLRSVSTVLQARVKGICKSGEAIRVITRKGAVSCTSVEVDASNLDVSSLSGVLQSRVKDYCKTGEAIRQIKSTGEVVCATTADGGEKITGVSTGGGLTGGGTNGNLTISSDPTALQRRVSGVCAGNQAVRTVGEDGTVGCNPFQVPLVDGGCTAASNAIQTVDATTGAVTCVPAVGSVTAGTGLTGGGGPGAVALAADTAYLQRRVTPGCAGSTAIQTVNAAGTVTCLATGTGSVTSVGVTAGSGLTATPNPITTTGTLGTDFATIQKRVGSACAGNNAIQAIAADGTVTCRSVVTSVAVAAGSGITVSPDPITGTGTVGTDFGTIQKRVGGTCAESSAIQSVAADGTVTCSASFAPAAKILTSGLQEQSHGGPDVVLLKNAYFEILGRCPAGEGVKIIAKANTGMNALVDSQVNGFHAVGTVAEDTLSNVTTNTADMAKYELGGTTGLAAGRTLSGGFYDFATVAGCQFAATGIAG